MIKKITFTFLLFACFFLSGCNNNPQQDEHKHVFNEGVCECGETDPNYQAPHEHVYVDGKCECGETDPNYQAPHEHVYVDGKCECGETEPKKAELIAIEKAIESIKVPTVTVENITLPKKYQDGELVVYISWQSTNLSAINNYGYIKQKNYEQTADLIATLECGSYEEEVIFSVTVQAFSDEYRVAKELATINVDSVLTDTTKLPTKTLDSGITIEWVLSHPEIFDNEGTYNYPTTVTEMTLTVILTLNDIQESKEFKMIAYKESSVQKLNMQNIIDSHSEFDNGVLINLEKKDKQYLVLKDGFNEGTYISPKIQASDFDVLVGSWSAITSQETGAVELSVRVLVDGVWSDYFTYGQWRLGDQNKGVSKTSSNGLAKMDEDTVFILNGKTATAYQYKVEFRRLSDELVSPQLILVANCIQVIGYEQVKLDYSQISQNVVYDVPQLNQNIVPIIGNSICSPTSTTMLLKYYGHSFVKEGYTYEHEYVANIAKDYGHNMFGNWVYNVAVMGAYGEYAYVKRFINNDELMWHLENIGPVALSVKGNMQGYYTTNGHLIVCKGYKIVDGNVIFICNDPNLKNVEVEYTYETIENVWREIAYVIDPSK